MLAFFRNEMGFGGNNGLTDFRDVLGFSLSADTTRAGLFVLSGLALAFGILLGRWITTAKFGKVLVAVRDAESRTRFMGYRVEHYKLFVFTVSAMLAGLAGALYVPQVGIINPSEFSPANSIEIVIWVALGGRGTLIGAALGALIVAGGEELADRELPRGLAVRARRGLHPRDDLPAEGRARPLRHPRVPAQGARADRTARAGGVARMAKETQLYLQDVHRSFDGYKAINGLSIAIAKGEMRAVVGPNGAGKTTMLDIITGKTRPDVRAAWSGTRTPT